MAAAEKLTPAEKKRAKRKKKKLAKQKAGRLKILTVSHEEAVANEEARKATMAGNLAAVAGEAPKKPRKKAKKKAAKKAAKKAKKRSAR